MRRRGIGLVSELDISGLGRFRIRSLTPPLNLSRLPTCVLRFASFHPSCSRATPLGRRRPTHSQFVQQEARRASRRSSEAN